MATKNNYKVNYIKRKLTLNYNGEVFNFNLNDGDVGDFWHSFTTSDNVVKDINFHQESEEVVPNLAIYGVKNVGKILEIDTSDEIIIKEFKQIGNPKKYFN